MRKIYRKKLEKLTDALLPFEPSVTISGEQAGMHVVLTVKHSLNAHELSHIALEHGIRITPIKEYTIAPTKENRDDQFLLGFGGFEENEIPNAIHQLMTCWGIKANKKKDWQ